MRRYDYIPAAILWSGMWLLPVSVVIALSMLGSTVLVLSVMWLCTRPWRRVGAR